MTCTLHHSHPLKQVDFWNTLQMNTNEETPVGKLHDNPLLFRWDYGQIAWKSSTAGSTDSHYKQLFLLLIGSCCECMSNGYFNMHLYDKNFHIEF